MIQFFLNNSVMEHFWQNIIFVIIDQQKILYKKVYSVCFFAITESFAQRLFL